MNNTDILEEFVKTYNEVVTERQEVIVNKKYLSEKIQAISNLIAENKELKENSIPKSKVEEKIEEINKVANLKNVKKITFIKIIVK